MTWKTRLFFSIKISTLAPEKLHKLHLYKRNMLAINQIIAQELGVNVNHADAAINLLDEGATVPFISRYRKELTGAMDDGQLRTLQERLIYLRELEERRATVLSSIEEQGKLTAELKQSILAVSTKTALEDLYLPYKPKRRTKGQIAIEAGLEPLADSLFTDPSQDPETLATQYLDKDKGIEDSKAALDGAKYILMERFAEDAELLAQLREYMIHKSRLTVSVVDGKQAEGEKFQDYFEYSEAFADIPSHRALAILRGRKEGILRSSLLIETNEGQTHPCEGMIAKHCGIEHQGRAADDWLQGVAQWTWRVKLALQIETDLMMQIRQSAEEDAITVFANNLKDLLLAAPAGARVTMGLDPGYRTGVKVAVVDDTGKVLDHTAIYPHAPQKQWDQALATLGALCQKHKVDLISIGNGTASRETDKLAADLIKLIPDARLTKIVVSEAGASVYSASELGAKEFPDLDVTIRGAISIARRLQDPLAELVKIEPKAIGVGQYQHDVNQTKLARSLDNVVEDCVNAVGVDVNTASAALLSYVSGLSSSLASNIVSHREIHGAFSNRQKLLDVPRLGAKVFEQAAGFLKVNGDNPLDASAVHPESYGVVEQIAQKNQRDVKSVIGDASFLRQLQAKDYISDNVGELTVKDIITELEKPGRDPRPEFKTAEFKEGVEKVSDLKPDMILEGVVTNVTNFGAFVDIGVHQDGLVHISALSNSFVKDPRAVVKAGDVVKVKVMEVDVQRKRIGLSMRLDDDSRDHAADKNTTAGKKTSTRKPRPAKQQASAPSGALADALAAALKK